MEEEPSPYMSTSWGLSDTEDVKTETRVYRTEFGRSMFILWHEGLRCEFIIDCCTCEFFIIFFIIGLYAILHMLR